jgi:hypothetical protein
MATDENHIQTMNTGKEIFTSPISLGKVQLNQTAQPVQRATDDQSGMTNNDIR